MRGRDKQGRARDHRTGFMVALSAPDSPELPGAGADFFFM
jgi:hypothetical protein